MKHVVKWVQAFALIGGCLFGVVLSIYGFFAIANYLDDNVGWLAVAAWVCAALGGGLALWFVIDTRDDE